MDMRNDLVNVNGTERGSPSPVRITEYPCDTTTNPVPFSSLDKAMIEDSISYEKLKALSGKSKLSDITVMCLQVNTTEASIGNIGDLLVNLERLKLTNSFISSIRDLGSSLSKLTSLSMAGCHLDDLEGITLMSQLKELYLAYNNIADLSPLSMMEDLEILDLEGNNVEDISQIEFLSLCPGLTTLTLEGNPVQQSPQPNMTIKDRVFYDYRAAILALIPSLGYLDNRSTTRDTDLDAASTCRDSVSSPLDDVCRLVHSSLKRNQDAGASQMSSDESDSTTTASGSVNVLVSRSLRSRPTTAHAAFTSDKDRGLYDFLSNDDGSQLAQGSSGVFCGSAGQALRHMAKKHKSKRGSCQPIAELPQETSRTEVGLDIERQDLFEELKQWKLQYEQKQQELPCNKSPVPTPPATRKPIRPHTAAVMGRRSPSHRAPFGASRDQGS